MTLTAPLSGLIALFRGFETGLVARSIQHSASKATRKPGHVTLLGAGPGAADLITLRGLAALRAADVVYYDRLADPALLDHVKPGSACISVGKAPGNHAMPQDRINRLLVQSAQQGHAVLRLKCGDPGIFGRGAEEAAALTEAGIGWSIIPGVTAACAAAATAQSFLTERGPEAEAIVAFLKWMSSIDTNGFPHNFIALGEEEK